MIQDKSFHLVSLGCAKNTVDSESMIQLLSGSGYMLVPEAQDAQVLIVNTCGFIGPAKDESYRALNELASQKTKGQTLIAAGCLTQRYGAEVVKQVSGIDGILGTRRWMDIVDLVQDLSELPHAKVIYHLPDTPALSQDDHGTSRFAVQGGSAYIKIADGCRRQCAFCSIPLIKGTSVSRRLEAILDEAQYLQARGIREIVLIAQDTTDYGHDLGMKDGLSHLLEKLTNQTPEINWIRIMYAFPGYVTDRLIELMASSKQILPYLDIPLQHAHPATLHRMQRPANMDWVYRTIEKLRSSIPEIAIRTTFIVGYPGETEEEFETLADFMTDIEFDRMGVFKYSFEPGTPAETLGDPVPEPVKQARLDRLMVLQQQISLQKNQSLIGKNLDVLIEGYGENITIGRSYRDAPEIDGLVLIEKEKPEIGKIVTVKVTGALVYDVTGKTIPSNQMPES